MRKGNPKTPEREEALGLLRRKEKTMESFLKALESDKATERHEEAVTIDLEDAKARAYIQIMGYAYEELKRRYKV